MNAHGGRENGAQSCPGHRIGMLFRIGPVNSGEALATVPSLSRAGVPNIVIGSLDELTNPAKYPLAFRTINTNTQWIAAANAYAVDVLKRREAALRERVHLGGHA